MHSIITVVVYIPGSTVVCQITNNAHINRSLIALFLLKVVDPRISPCTLLPFSIGILLLGGIPSFERWSNHVEIGFA